MFVLTVKVSTFCTRWKFQACLRKSVIPLFVTAGFIIVFTAGSCSDGGCVTFSFAIGRNMVDGYALLGHVFENVSVAGVIHCYHTCQPNCRCISFNFLTTVNQDNCQLNSENKHLKPGALVRMEGSYYYDLVIKYNLKVNTDTPPTFSESTLRGVEYSGILVTGRSEDLFGDLKFVIWGLFGSEIFWRNFVLVITIIIIVSQ